MGRHQCRSTVNKDLCYALPSAPALTWTLSVVLWGASDQRSCCWVPDMWKESSGQRVDPNEKLLMSAPIIDWRSVLPVPRLSQNVSVDLLQPPRDPKSLSSIAHEWINNVNWPAVVHQLHRGQPQCVVYHIKSQLRNEQNGNYRISGHLSVLWFIIVHTDGLWHPWPQAWCN